MASDPHPRRILPPPLRALVLTAIASIAPGDSRPFFVAAIAALSFPISPARASSGLSRRPVHPFA